jgi:hypothetical protein
MANTTRRKLGQTHHTAASKENGVASKSASASKVHCCTEPSKVQQSKVPSMVKHRGSKVKSR